MFTLWTDLERAFFSTAARPSFDRQLEYMMKEMGYKAQHRDPRMRLEDLGHQLKFTMELPGVAMEDVEVTLHHDTLMVSAHSKKEAPEGYQYLLSERQAAELRHSISLPVSIDPEKTKATLKDGLLSITLETAPESKPRQITVSAG